MKAARIRVPKGVGGLSTPGQRNALARRIKAKTAAWSKKVSKGL